MKGVSRVFGAVLCTALLSSFAPAAASADPSPEPRNIAGSYLSTGDSTKSVKLKAIDSNAYRVFGDDWQGVGLLDGATYLGVFHRDLEPGSHRHGTHRGTLRPDGSLAIHGEFLDGSGKAFDVVWAPDRSSRPRPGPPPPQVEPRIVPKPAPQQGDRLPALGDYVYVEELPEAITKVPPVYPDAPGAAKLEGTVLIQALVGKDGRVLDAKIVKSIPGLDEAAVDAVRQWVFKPAQAGGKPVAVWVAVPVRFSLR
jgi:TonB family protein